MEENKETRPPDLGRFRILIVDDDPDLTFTYKAALKGEFVVDAFNDPSEALSRFKPGFYDLLLLDVKMPKMNGFELHQELVKIDNKAKVCFITSFVTYYESLSDIYPEFRVDCFIRKPIEPDALIRKIRTELGR